MTFVTSRIRGDEMQVESEAVKLLIGLLTGAASLTIIGFAIDSWLKDRKK